MAQYDSDARIYADLIRDKNRLKAQIAGGTVASYQVKKDDSGRVMLRDQSPVIRIRSANDDAWIWGHPSQAIWGITKWGTGSTGQYSKWEDIMRRRWEWERKQDFKRVIAKATLSGEATVLNATNNPYYLKAERVE